MTQLLVQRGVIFLKPVAEEEISTGGIIVAATTSRGNVAEISEIHEADAAARGLAVGNRVLFNPFSVREINLSGTEKRLAILASDVLATLENNDESD